MKTGYQAWKRRHFAARLDVPVVTRRRHRTIPIAPVAVAPDISAVFKPRRVNVSLSVLGER